MSRPSRRNPRRRGNVPGTDPADSSTGTPPVRVLAAFLLAAVAAAFGCLQGPADERRELVVYAASSLTEAFPRIAEAFEARRPEAGAVVFNFAGSATLRSQLEFGAPADVFASADAAQMDLAVAAGVIDGAPAVFATNAVAVVIPREAARARRLEDLAEPGLRIVLASEHVPAGSYARAVLANLDAADPGFADRVLANVVSEETNVREVLAKVVLGEADAGFVYATDAGGGPNADRLAVLPLPDGANVAASYVAGRVAGRPQPDDADAFIAFLASGEARAILAEAGFGAPAAPE